MPVLFLLSGPKMFFAQQGRRVAPINVTFGMGEQIKDPPPLPNFTFIGVEMWEYSPQNCQHFEFWP